MRFEDGLKKFGKFLWMIFEEIWGMVLCISFITYVLTSGTSYDMDCLEEIAEPLCEEYGQVFKNVGSGHFMCYTVSERQNDVERYRFLDEEKERCAEGDGR